LVYSPHALEPNLQHEGAIVARNKKSGKSQGLAALYCILPHATAHNSILQD
jgi:hypothetical protein